MPLRGVLRSPQRTLVTAAGLGAVITVVVALLGTWDVFGDLITRSERETVDPAPSRVIATLGGIGPAGEVAAAASTAPGVAEAEPWLRVPVTAAGPDHGSLDLLLGTPVGDAAIWRPHATSGELAPGEEGVLLSEIAADDLGVDVGDEVLLRHPAATADGVELAATPVRVAGTHADPFRAFAYMTPDGAEALGLGGLANSLDVLPEAGVDPEAVVRELVLLPGVATAQPASATTEALRETIDEFRAILVVPIAVGLLLAVLIAFNSSTIEADERQRENATMFAFGLGPRVPIGVAMGESLVVGVIGTAIGMVLGIVMLGWIVNVQFPDVVPDVGARIVISAGTLGWAALAGIVAVALAPLLTLPRVRRMDVPSSLRVME
jgi:putative ABC transport system permease protein